MIKFLKSNSDYISNVALSIAEKRQDEELIPSIMSNLNLPKTALQARQALKKYQNTMIIDHFEKLSQSLDIQGNTIMDLQV